MEEKEKKKYDQFRMTKQEHDERLKESYGLGEKYYQEVEKNQDEMFEGSENSG